MPKRDDTSEDSSEDENDSQEENKIFSFKPKIERIDKFKTLKKITINVSMTQYPVVSEIAESLGWRIQTSNDAGDWDIYWTDFSIDPDVLIKMHLFQKINHFPGIHTIARKNLLGNNLTKMGKKHPEEYNFFPMTWMLPQQYSEFRQYFESKQKGKARTYIVKPEADCQGRGIFLTRKLSDIETGKHYVVQRYMARPFLLDGLKFDMRIYVLMCGTDPLKLYLYNEGLARLATEKYQEPLNSNLDRLCMHLTNYAINKHSPNFIFNNNVNNMGIGHKRALSCVYKQLAQAGLDTEAMKAKIKDVIIKTIISGLPLMAHQYKCSQPEDYSGNMCFHILGMDVMINSKGEPFVIEVNHTPSFTTDTPLDHKIKYSLIKDTLVLMNINVKQKNELMNKCKEYASERLLTGKRHIYEGEDREAMIKQAQEEREKYENENLGGFEKIFPLENPESNEKYMEMIETSIANYQGENQSNKAKIEEKEMKKLMKSELKILQRKTKEKTQINLAASSPEILESNLIMGEREEEDEPIYEASPRNIDLTLSQPIPKKIEGKLSNSSSRKEIIKKGIKIESESGTNTSIGKVNTIKKGIGKGISQISTISEKKEKNEMNFEEIKLFDKGPRSMSKRSTPSSSLKSRKNYQAELVNEFPVIEAISNATCSEQMAYENQNKKKSADKVITLQSRFSLKSETKPTKIISMLEKEVKNSGEKRVPELNFTNKGFVMPRIINFNGEERKKEDQFNFLTMGRRIQSTGYPTGTNVNNG